MLAVMFCLTRPFQSFGVKEEYSLCRICHMFRSDVDSALTALEYCVKHFNKAPDFSSILKFLINAEDADKLQKGIYYAYITS